MTWLCWQNSWLQFIIIIFIFMKVWITWLRLQTAGYVIEQQTWADRCHSSMITYLAKLEEAYCNNCWYKHSCFRRNTLLICRGSGVLFMFLQARNGTSRFHHSPQQDWAQGEKFHMTFPTHEVNRKWLASIQQQYDYFRFKALKPCCNKHSFSYFLNLFPPLVLFP